MKRKSRIGEVVCRCRAYRFPHRMMGGRCKGNAFVEEHFESNSMGSCRQCRYWFADNGIECEVLNGQEPAWECQELSAYLDTQEVPTPVKFKRKRWS